VVAERLPRVIQSLLNDPLTLNFSMIQLCFDLTHTRVPRAVCSGNYIDLYSLATSSIQDWSRCQLHHHPRKQGPKTSKCYQQKMHPSTTSSSQRLPQVLVLVPSPPRDPQCQRERKRIGGSKGLSRNCTPQQTLRFVMSETSWGQST